MHDVRERDHENKRWRTRSRARKILAHAGRPDEAGEGKGRGTTHTRTPVSEKRRGATPQRATRTCQTHAHAARKRADTHGPPPADAAKKGGKREGEIHATSKGPPNHTASGGEHMHSHPSTTCLCVSVWACVVTGALPGSCFRSGSASTLVRGVNARTHAMKQNMSARNGLSCGATQTRRRTASESTTSSSHRRASPGASSSRSGRSG